MSQVTMKGATNLVFLLTVGIFLVHYNLLNLAMSIPGTALLCTEVTVTVTEASLCHLFTVMSWSNLAPLPNFQP